MVLLVVVVAVILALRPPFFSQQKRASQICGRHKERVRECMLSVQCVYSLNAHVHEQTADGREFSCDFALYGQWRGKERV